MAIDTLISPRDASSSTADSPTSPPPPTGSGSGPSSSSSQPTTTGPTNTLIIASLPTPFFHPRIQAALRTHFEAFGEIHTWAPLKGLGRIMVVYWDEEGGAVEGAKGLDGVVIGPASRRQAGSRDGGDGVGDLTNEKEIDETSYILRVFRALPTPLSILKSLSDPSNSDPSHYLAPPALEKNFLISPPGSPPIGWEQVAEDPPNAAPLAEDLLAALESLQLNRGLGAAMDLEEDGRAMLVRAEEVDGGVGVWVEDVERIEGGGSGSGHGREEEEDVGEGEWYDPPLVAMPPSTGPRIVPRTARPPMPKPIPASMPPT